MENLNRIFMQKVQHVVSVVTLQIACILLLWYYAISLRFFQNV